MEPGRKPGSDPVDQARLAGKPARDIARRWWQTNPHSRFSGRHSPHCVERALDLEGAIQLNVVDFKDMIQQVVFAASTDEARPVLMGVLLQVDKDKVTMAAADGFRLSVRKAVLSNPAQQPMNIIIPARALNELARYLPQVRNAPRDEAYNRIQMAAGS